MALSVPAKMVTMQCLYFALSGINPLDGGMKCHASGLQLIIVNLRTRGTGILIWLQLLRTECCQGRYHVTKHMATSNIGTAAISESCMLHDRTFSIWLKSTTQPSSFTLMPVNLVCNAASKHNRQLHLQLQYGSQLAFAERRRWFLCTCAVTLSR